ncbi:MAG: PD-(D/E)XK nuclease family protein [Bacteroidales bacterium]|nr:PD-(D/E)XK nuclease family protein [Bacteroidales bacterium]
MKPFLKQVALHYYRQDGLGEKIFVFPNRRSMAFFRKHLCDFVKADGKPMLAPRLTTVGDFICQMTGASTSDRISLLLELYDTYCSLNPQAEKLDDFIYWGDVLLADFDDVDKYRVDAKGLFANIADLKAMQDDYSYADKKQKDAIEKLVRNFDNVTHSGNPRRDVKENFLQIWNILYPLYTNYKQNLRWKDMAYEGMIYRDLAEVLDEKLVADLLETAFPGTSTCVFVGLNALNECEKSVMKKLQNAGLAEFCWDYTGKFIEENLKLFPNVFTPEGGDRLPKVHVVKVPSATGQAKMLPVLIDQVPDKERGLDFAVVLADETMLMPVLNSLPKCKEGVNVTMGYPMDASEWSSLMRDVLEMQMHLRPKGGEHFFYHKDVKDILSSAILQALLDEEEKKTVGSIVSAAKFYIPRADFGQGQLLSAIFRPVVTKPGEADATQIRALADYLLDLTQTIASRLQGLSKEYDLQLDFAKRYYCAVVRLRDLDRAMLPRTWAHLLNQILAGESVPFDGNPLGGLQVMGPLETRALDFKHIVILNANEGVFPRIGSGASFVPAEVRQAFGLPTYQRQEDVWAYYFYRLIHRAENVWMLYDSRSDGLNTGEESRYAKQLRYLGKHWCTFEESVAQADVSHSEDVSVIPKTAEDIERIKNHLFSPSSFHTYLDCPAKFYYNVVMGLKAEDEVKESLDSGLLGNICHDTLHALYIGEEAMNSDEPFDKRDNKYADFTGTVTKEYLLDWQNRKDDIKRKVLSLIRAELKTVEVTGRDLVTADIIVNYVLQVIKSDLKLMGNRRSLEILGLEAHLGPVEICGHKFHGYIDRIDSFEDGTARVVDYKTGSDRQNVLSTSLKPSSIFKGDNVYANKAALQFFIYDRLVENNPRCAGLALSNSMYAMSDFFEEDVRVWEQDEEFNKSVEEELQKTFDEMENPETGFKKVDKNSNSCKFCDFRVICGRELKK